MLVEIQCTSQYSASAFSNAYPPNRGNVSGSTEASLYTMRGCYVQYGRKTDRISRMCSKADSRTLDKNMVSAKSY